MVTVFTIPVGGNEPRLTGEEAATLAKFCFAIHDHSASAPAVAKWWHRTEEGTFNS
jgi:hypothetical protein